MICVIDLFGPKCPTENESSNTGKAEMSTERLALVDAASELDQAAGGWSIRQRLTLIVLVVVIPMLLLSAAIVWSLAQYQAAKSRESLMCTSRSIMTAVDAQLGKYVAAAQVLAKSESLQREDLTAFRNQAERAVTILPGTWVSLADARGQRLLNTLVPPGTPLPLVAPDVMADQVRAFETKQIQISNEVLGPAARIHAIAVGAPVFRADVPLYYLVVGVDVSSFRELLNSQGLPEGWLAGVIDRAGNFIARSRDHERWVGKPAAQGWRAWMQQNGVFETRALEGQPVVYANAVSLLSGWATAAAEEKSVLEAPIGQTILVAGLTGLAVTLLSMLFAACAARRITVPIKALEAGAHAMRLQQPVAFATTGVLEVDHALRAFDAASKALFELEEQRKKAETALKASEERLRLFVEQAPASIAMFDRSMRYLSVSRRWLAQFSPYEQDVVGRSHYEIFPEIPERRREIHRRALNGEVLKDDDDPFLRADGRTQWIAWEIRPWYASDDGIGGIVIFAEDVTPQHEVAAALKESEERFRLLVNGTRDYAIYMLDPNGLIAFWNEGCRRLKGYDADEIIGRHFSVFHTADDIAAGELEVAVREGAYESEHEEVKKNGTRFWASSLTTPIYDKSGKLRGFSRITRDITERRNAERQLAAVTARLRATVETAVDAIVVIDEDGTVQSVNPAVERIFGYHADELVGKSITLLMPEPHRSAHHHYVDAYLRTGVAKIIGIGREVDGRRKDGTVFPIDLAVSEWCMAGKRFFTGIMRDITSRKQSEEHVRRIMRELSHRTKNVLTVVQVMTWQTAWMGLGPEDFTRRFTQRIDALIRSHDLLANRGWDGADLEELIHCQLDPFLDKPEARLALRGRALYLRPEAAETLGLALHELVTNATTYGALSCPTGTIEIVWRVDPDPPTFHMTWRETNGPLVSPPRQNGFGHSVLKNAVPKGLGGKAVLRFAPQGFVWQLEASVDRMIAVKVVHDV